MQNFIKADEFSKPITATRIKESILMTIPTAIYAVIYLVWFNYIETRKVIHFTEMHTRLDDMIPFMEVFVIPYILWFFFIAFCTAYPLLKYEKEDYWRFMIFLGTGMTLFLIISTIFPTIQYLRPTQFERNNIFTALVSVFYKYDTPTNVFPSMHVYNAIGGAFSIQYSKRFSKGWKLCSHFISLSIVLSTMFIKQHCVIDVVSAIALALIMYYVVYRSDITLNFLRKIHFIDPVMEDGEVATQEIRL